MPRPRRSKRAQKAKKALANRPRKLANGRKHLVNQTTAKLVGQHSLLATEDLSTGNITASAKGPVEKSGKNVKAWPGLNRAILDTAPRSFLNVLCIKAEDAGCRVGAGSSSIDFVGVAGAPLVADMPVLSQYPQKSACPNVSIIRVWLRGNARPPGALSLPANGLTHSGGGGPEPTWVASA